MHAKLTSTSSYVYICIYTKALTLTMVGAGQGGGGWCACVGGEPRIGIDPCLMWVLCMECTYAVHVPACVDADAVVVYSVQV